MDTIIPIIQLTLVIWAVGFVIAGVLMFPIALLAFGLGATLQGACLAAATPYVVAVVAPIPIFVTFLIVDEVQRQNRIYRLKNRF